MVADETLTIYGLPKEWKVDGREVTVVLKPKICLQFSDGIRIWVCRVYPMDKVKVKVAAQPRTYMQRPLSSHLLTGSTIEMR